MVQNLRRQPGGVVAKFSLAEIGEQLRPARRGEQQVGQAVAVVVGPGRAAGAADVRQADFVVRAAAVLKQRSAIRAVQQEVHLLVAVEIDRGHADRLRVHPAERADVREAGHPANAPQVFAPPTDEIALRVVVLQFQARLQALNFARAQVERHLVAVDHAGDDRLAASDDGLNRGDHLFGLAGETAQEERLGVAHGPPVAAGVGLIPIVVDAHFAGVVFMEEDGDLARLGPFHDAFPFALVKTVLADLVADDVLWILALEVLNLAIDDQVLGLLYLLDLEDHDEVRFRNDAAQGVGNLDVCASGRGGEKERDQNGTKHRVENMVAIHDDSCFAFLSSGFGDRRSGLALTNSICG